MHNEKKKLLITIALLLVLIVVMIFSQMKGEDVVEDTTLIETDDVEDVVEDTDVVEDEVDVVVPDVPVEETVVEVNEGIIIEDITDEVNTDKVSSTHYYNQSLGLSYNYNSGWVNNENSVPGLYTVRVEDVLEGDVEAYARVDFRYYTATVDTDNVVLTNIAGIPSFFDENYTAQEVVMIPLDGKAELGVGDWTNKVLQVTYGVYSDGEMSDETLENLFDVNMGDFNVILGSLKISQ